MVKVEVISKERIKPSSPTPLHLRSFNLSLLDQLAPRFYIPLLLFYTAKDSNHLLQTNQVAQKLRTSLSKTLAIFYPLAGRLKDDDTIDCNDQGVEVFHARVDEHLSEFLKKPHMEVLDQLVPGESFCTRSGADVPLAIQVNSFECGGVAIGVRLSHKIADGTAMAEFISKWAATARATNEAMDTTLVSASIFQPRSSVSSYLYPTSETIVTRRLVLDASAIAALRAKAAGHPTLESPPTRVVAVSALIWRCFMKAKRDKGPTTVSVSTHAVNVRGRMRPLVPESYFGNLWVATITEGVMISECNGDMQGVLEKQLGNAIKAVDSDFIEELKGPDGSIKAHEGMKKVAENYWDSDVHLCHFSSWCRFPFYEVDFGWGKPIWVSICTIPIKTSAVFIGRRWDDGMEVWVNMEADEMAKFEQDQELLSFVRIP
ncbi:vinorine synthase [Cinnamomum micranthum f. kanehirae]|uniref:Vinorine synthase n=1 Tax=Cinnamomum micranthum f. kanehirae TaxID=337451 RepID=A0A3S3PVN7_9MAGN|nr:vinorine synthase [Cinnamomum micranthum f. kanehirae]